MMAVWMLCFKIWHWSHSCVCYTVYWYTAQITPNWHILQCELNICRAMQRVLLLLSWLYLFYLSQIFFLKDCKANITLSLEAFSDMTCEMKNVSAASRRSQKYLQPIMCSKGRLIRMHKGLVHCPFNLGFFWEFISTYAIWQPLKQQQNINQ